MYIMLLKEYCSSFLAVIAWTFDWLTDGRSLKKAKLNRLINSVCFRVWLIIKKAKHGNYRLKMHMEKHSTWCLKVYSKNYSTWYMKAIWKVQYKFADAEINWLKWWYSSQFTHSWLALWTFDIVKDDIYFLPYHFTNADFCH